MQQRSIQPIFLNNDINKESENQTFSDDNSISHQPQSNENNINPLATSGNDENGESDSNA